MDIELRNKNNKILTTTKEKLWQKTEEQRGENNIYYRMRGCCRLDFKLTILPTFNGMLRLLVGIYVHYDVYRSLYVHTYV